MRLTRLIPILLMTIVSGCDGGKEIWYQNAKSDEKWNQQNAIIKTFSIDSEIPDYIIVRDDLYLNIQSVRHRFIFTQTSHMRWNEKVITNLKKKDKNFRDKLPNPNEPLGGIKWLHVPASKSKRSLQPQ
jgi:hypothetical protein